MLLCVTCIPTPSLSCATEIWYLWVLYDFSTNALTIRKKRPQRERVETREVRKKRRLLPGTVMFPTTHDITPGNLWACEALLQGLIQARNQEGTPP